MQSSSMRMSVKATSEAGFVSGHARRQQALDRQRRDRQAQTAAARHHHQQQQQQQQEQAVVDAVTLAAPDLGGERRVCEIPEWMVDIPDDLFGRWSVVARPEGQRCIAFCQYGRTSLRSVENRFLRACRTALPNGGPRSGTSAQVTVVECIVQERTLFVLDVLAWKGYDLVNSPREFRQFWLQTKAVEDRIVRDDDDDVVVVPLFAARCSAASIACAYRGLAQAQSDGVVFYHDEALYTGGCTPLTLLWKDAACSRFYIEGDPHDPQQICLRCDAATGAVATEDGVVLGRIDPGSDARLLQRFSIDGIDPSANSPVVIGMRHLGSFAAAKVIAHTWSKIVFQYGARQGRNFVEIDDLLNRMG